MSNTWQKSNAGLLMAHASWALPFLAVGLKFIYDAFPGAAYIGLIAAGGLCALGAIFAMFRWNYRGIGLFAVIGLAISIFLLGMYYSGYVTEAAFQKYGHSR